MRYHAPARGTVDAGAFARQPLAAWRDHAAQLGGVDWPSIDTLNDALPSDAYVRFVAQTPELLADGLHYEQRIAERGEIATREGNWHDLLNALIWQRHPALKQALNRRQVDEIARMGPKQRSRPQYAMTHFDEAGEEGAIARSAADAPEIDGTVIIDDGQKLRPGQFVDVVVESADDHDLHARLVG